MEPPNELFRMISSSDPVTEFCSTPIHRFFRTKAIPGVHEKEELLLAKKGFRNPMDLVLKIRELRGCKMYYCKRWRTLWMIDYLEGFGICGLNSYQAAVSLVNIEAKAPREGLIAL